MSKQEWKESGTELGHAFKTFGKTFLRSVDTTTDRISEFMEEELSPDPNRDIVQPQPNSTVYSDGSWKKVGRELGNGFLGVGMTMLHTVGLEPMSDVSQEDDVPHGAQESGTEQASAENGSGD